MPVDSTNTTPTTLASVVTTGTRSATRVCRASAIMAPKMSGEKTNVHSRSHTNVPRIAANTSSTTLVRYASSGNGVNC